MPSTKEKLLELSRQLQYCAVDGGCINCERWEFDCGSRKCLDDLLLKAAELLESVANGVTVQQWISVKDRLPNLIPCSAGTGYSEAVNVLTEGRKVLTAIWDGTDFIADADFWDAEGEKITHWTPVLLPLPEPSAEG